MRHSLAASVLRPNSRWQVCGKLKFCHNDRSHVPTESVHKRANRKTAGESRHKRRRFTYRQPVVASCEKRGRSISCLPQSLTQNDGRTNLHILIDMALSSDLNTPEMNEKYRIFQLNRNAANIFSGTGQAITRAVIEDEYALQKICSFWLPENQKFNRDPGFAGHFQKIFEVLARKNTDWLEGFDMPKFLSFLCENVDVPNPRQWKMLKQLDERGNLDSKDLLGVTLSRTAWHAPCKFPADSQPVI